MQSEWNRGAKLARDLTLSTIIGMQNDIGNQNDVQYQILQTLMENIIKNQGDLMEPFKE